MCFSTQCIPGSHVVGIAKHSSSVMSVGPADRNACAPVEPDAVAPETPTPGSRTLAAAVTGTIIRL